MCSVANTRCPVSAAVSAVEIVSRSRISPTRITSGSWRSAAFSASPKLCASEPSSRWLTRHFLCPCRNSIGSSIVMMCSSRVLLISSIIAASEVDFPEPVGPVTSTKPRGLRVNSWTGGRQAELVDARHPERDQAERRADRSPLVVGVDAEAGVARDRVGEVELPVRLQALALVAREDRVDDLAGVGGGQLGVVLQRLQASADADCGVSVRAQVQVRRTAVYDLHQQVCEINVHSGAHRPPVRPRTHRRAPAGRTFELRRRVRRPERVPSAQFVPITRVTSAIEVRPCLTFCSPSSRRRVMPCCTATTRIASAGWRSSAIVWISGLIFMTS